MKIPKGFARVTPYVFAVDADNYLTHIASALDGEITGRSMRDDGKLANGRVRFDSASIMVSEAGRGFPPSQASFYLYVEDAGKAMARALKNGMQQIMAVADMPYGDRQGGVRDKAGNIWWISERLSDQPY